QPDSLQTPYTPSYGRRRTAFPGRLLETVHPREPSSRNQFVIASASAGGGVCAGRSTSDGGCWTRSAGPSSRAPPIGSRESASSRAVGRSSGFQASVRATRASSSGGTPGRYLARGVGGAFWASPQAIRTWCSLDQGRAPQIIWYSIVPRLKTSE